MVGRRKVIACAAPALALGLVVGTAVANGHKQNRHREREHQQARSEHAVPAVDNPTYQEVCGACHFPLQPALLPSRSWRLLLDGSQEHFGLALDLEPEQLAELETYLTANAAEHAPGELAQEIIDCIGSSTPLRVTDIPMIRNEHRRLDPEVFQRPSVSGRADCQACHQGAASGIYDDDVTIPST